MENKTWLSKPATILLSDFFLGVFPLFFPWLTLDFSNPSKVQDEETEMVPETQQEPGIFHLLAARPVEIDFEWRVAVSPPAKLWGFGRVSCSRISYESYVCMHDFFLVSLHKKCTAIDTQSWAIFESFDTFSKAHHFLVNISMSCFEVIYLPCQKTTSWKPC